MVFSLAKFRCGKDCWVPKYSRVKKNMIKKGLITKRDNHDNKAIKLFNSENKENTFNKYFNYNMSIEFDKLNMTCSMGPIETTTTTHLVGC